MFFPIFIRKTIKIDLNKTSLSDNEHIIVLLISILSGFIGYFLGGKILFTFLYGLFFSWIFHMCITGIFKYIKTDKKASFIYFLYTVVFVMIVLALIKVTWFFRY